MQLKEQSSDLIAMHSVVKQGQAANEFSLKQLPQAISSHLISQSADAQTHVEAEVGVGIDSFSHGLDPF